MNKGDIYYISKNFENENSQFTLRSGRPAIIVSCGNVINNHNTLNVVFLTTKPKSQEPTHFIVNCKGTTSTAIVENIVTVDKANIGDYIGQLNSSEMEQLDAALRYVLDLNGTLCDIHVGNSDEVNKLKEKIEIYKEMLKESMGGN